MKVLALEAAPVPAPVPTHGFPQYDLGRIREQFSTL
jgi:hypothetical protein